MAPSIADLRKAIAASKEKSGGNPQNNKKRGGDNASFPFWDIPEGSTATVRFLPDGDENNAFFWVTREVIKMPFAGVVGGDYNTDREVTVTVPCVDMFGMNCPIIATTRPWWKDPSKEALARMYWKKKSFIFQGFVVNSPFTEENTPENPIRRFVINKSIFDIIEKSLISEEMEDMPTDFIGGRDFKIAKTKKGEYANYSTSSWSFKTRSLTEDEMGAMQTYGLHDLKQALGRRPDEAEMEVIKAMFEASVAGEPFDMASFSEYYRPYGAPRGSDESNARVERQVEAAARPSIREAVSSPAARVEEEAPASSKPNPQDILARIRARAGQ